MREPYSKDIKEDILHDCFYYYVRNGLENASIKNLCESTGISSGSIYYWFKDKDEVILDVTKYGLEFVTSKLFEYAFERIAYIKEIIEQFPAEVMKYKSELRFIYQVTTSNQYGDAMRSMADKFNVTYEQYAKRLSEYLKIEYKTLRPFVYLLISAVLDYIVWEEKDKIEMELMAIYSTILYQKNNS